MEKTLFFIIIVWDDLNYTPPHISDALFVARGGGGGGGVWGSKNGQKMTFFASMLMPKRGRYSPRHPRGVKKGGKSAPWSRFWAVSQGGPPI